MIKILKYGETENDKIFARSTAQTDVSGIVSEIIERVRKYGDAALFEYAKQFDKADLKSLTVSEKEMDDAFSSVDKEFKKILETAAENIREFHSKQLRDGFRIEKDGIVLGQKITPVSRAGLYVPGGTAAYPSTVLMDAIPAVIAGVPEVVMTTPPDKNGNINPVILAAAKIAGVKTVYKMGGAQAIAALSYGTETVKKVDKIVGPGNAFVAEAKRQVFGRVSIDMIAGPSEIMIIADGKNNPSHIAADMLSQAEHDKMASAVLITDDADFSLAVASEIENRIKTLPRYEIARKSIDDNGKIIIAKDIKQAVYLANEIAPEHLEICLDNPFDILPEIKNAGSVFLGRNCPEALGDYLAGPNHTLPTGGTAKFSSPLSVDDFIKKTQYIYYEKDALNKVADKVAYFAEKEGLRAHGISATVRKNKE